MKRKFKCYNCKEYNYIKEDKSNYSIQVTEEHKTMVHLDCSKCGSCCEYPVIPEERQTFIDFVEEAGAGVNETLAIHSDYYNRQKTYAAVRVNDDLVVIYGMSFFRGKFDLDRNYEFEGIYLIESKKLRLLSSDLRHILGYEEGGDIEVADENDIRKNLMDTFIDRVRKEYDGMSRDNLVKLGAEVQQYFIDTGAKRTARTCVIKGETLETLTPDRKYYDFPFSRTEAVEFFKDEESYVEKYYKTFVGDNRKTILHDTLEHTYIVEKFKEIMNSKADIAHLKVDMQKQLADLPDSAVNVYITIQTPDPELQIEVLYPLSSLENIITHESYDDISVWTMKPDSRREWESKVGDRTHPSLHKVLTISYRKKKYYEKREL